MTTPFKPDETSVALAALEHYGFFLTPEQRAEVGTVLAPNLTNPLNLLEEVGRVMVDPNGQPPAVWERVARMLLAQLGMLPVLERLADAERARFPARAEVLDSIVNSVRAQCGALPHLLTDAATPQGVLH